MANKKAAPRVIGENVPTIGRIVIYNADDNEWPAIIVEVETTGGLLHLGVFTSGTTTRGYDVKYSVPEGTGHHTWRWPTRT